LAKKRSTCYSKSQSANGENWTEKNRDFLMRNDTENWRRKRPAPINIFLLNLSSLSLSFFFLFASKALSLSLSLYSSLIHSQTHSIYASLCLTHSQLSMFITSKHTLTHTYSIHPLSLRVPHTQTLRSPLYCLNLSVSL